MTIPQVRRAIRITVLLLLWTHAVAAQELKVMISGAFSAPYLEVVPAFERATKYRVVTVSGASLGGAPDSIPVRLERGEPADVLIMAASALDDLIRQGKAVSGSRVDLVKSSIGMAVRAGARRPDISTVDALKRTLLDAKSVAYSASASGAYISTELFQRLGIADEMRSKSRRIESERVGAVIARGDAEIGFQQISELLPIEAITYVGPLPAEVQRVTVFSAGIAASSKQREAARGLIAFLASPAVTAAVVKSGLEPVATSPDGLQSQR